MNQSLVTVFRDGSWRRLSGGLLPLLATVAVIADVTTTTHILYSSEYRESNQVLAWLADLDPTLSLVVFVGYCLFHLAIAWLSLGWLSRVVGVFLVIVMGSGGLNNLVLFATGMSMYSHLGLPTTFTVHVLKPILGVSVGLLTARRRAPLPWHEVAVVVAPGAVIIVWILLGQN